MKVIEVKPKKGLIVRDPITKAALPQDKWSTVPYNTYWRRREIDGSITVKSNKPKVEAKKLEPDYRDKSFKGGKNK